VAYPALVRRFPGNALGQAADELTYRKVRSSTRIESLPVLLGS